MELASLKAHVASHVEVMAGFSTEPFNWIFPIFTAAEYSAVLTVCDAPL